MRHLLLVALASLTVAGAAPAAAAESMLSTPAAGNNFQDFIFRGSGFTPGTVLDVRFARPDGTKLTFEVNGAPAVLMVDSHGNFEFQVVPVVDLRGVEAGFWQGLVCLGGGETCWSATFEISP